MKLFLYILSLLLIIPVAAIHAQPLAGTFTIGVGGDYASFSAAAADLNSLGVAGPVVFEVISGVYDDQLDLGTITGTSATNSITFRAQSGNAADVTLQANSIPLGSFVVRFNGADFVRLEDLTLNNGAALQTVVEILTGSSDNAIRRCIIAGSATGIRARGQGILNLAIENNTIESGEGIRLEGQFSSNDLRQPLIAGNILPNGSFSNGIVLTRVDGAHVTGNRVETRSRSIWLTQCSSNTRRTLVINNFAAVNAILAIALDIFDQNSGIDVFNNSLSAFGIRNLTSYGLRVLAGSSDIRLFNNSVTNFGQSAAVKVEDPASISASDFNNFYSDWVALALWNGTQTDLAGLQAATGFDGNSVSVFPNYVSDSDLHTPSPYLDGAGTPLGEVTVDIDGEPRDGSFPDIGADEFTSDPAATPLSGSFTVGSGGSYPTIGAAVADLALRGINGPLTINLLPGVYNETVEIPSITGSDSLNRVTIRSQGGDTAAVRITFSSSANRNATILLNSADFITLEHLTLENTSPGAAVGAVVKFLDQARGVIVQNCRMLNPNGAYTVWSDEQHPDAVIIRNNDIFANFTGIHLQGLVFGPYIRTPQLSGNIISSTGEGIRLQHTDGFFALGNQIDTRSVGIYLLFNSANVRRSRIANNFIRVSSVINRGVWVSQHNSDLDILNNSINCTDPNNTDNSALRIENVNNSGIRVLNNSLVNSGRARAYVVNDPAAVIESDFNNIWAAGHTLATWNGAQAELPDLQAASGMDLNSISVFPNYLSDIDLHTLSPYLDGAGIPLPEVTDDIDGEPRSGSAPDIGADEYASDPAATPLAGSFTIGGGGNYPDFQSAIDDAELRGVNGPVTFEVFDGIYSEQLVIHDITGADSLNTVTFRAQSGDSSMVTLTFNNTNSATNYLVQFNSADFVRLERLTLEATGTTFGRVIDFRGKAEGVEIRRCRLINRSTDMIHSDNQFPDRLRIVENRFIPFVTFGGDAIRITGFSFGPFVKKLDITGNRFIGGLNANGVLLTRVNGARIVGNHFDIRNMAVRMDNCPGSIRRHLIANNFIHNTVNTAKAIQLTNGTGNCDVFYNSVNSTAGFVNPMHVAGSAGGDIRIANNIFKTENSFAYLVENAAAVSLSDHNNLFSVNSALASWNGVSHSTLAGLQAASGMDLNSVSIDPPFVSITDLHLQSGEMDSLGMPLAEVNSDFDHDPRDAFFPDIGADEINPITVANAIPDLSFPEDSGPASASPDLNQVFANPNAGTTLSFTATSTIPEIIPILNGSALEVDAALNFFGSATVTVEAANGLGQIARDHFLVTVTPVNDAPIPGLLLQPGAGDTLAVINRPNRFCWQGATDVDGDPLTYRLRIFDDSLDIDIPDITDTCFAIPGGTFLIGQQHRWAVLADDGTVTVSGDTATFFTPPFLFTDIHAGLSRVGNGDGVWGDYDNDGDLDLALAGQRDSLSTVNPFSGIFRNDNGSFSDINAGLAQLSAGILAWGDYDNDNDLDLFLGGYPGSGSPNEAYIYRNDNGSFVDINANLTGVSNGTAEWGDFDNDGDLDLLVTGAQFVLNTPATRLYRNDDGVFDVVNTGLRDVQLGDAAWGDYDNDGDLDIALSGVSTDSNGDVEIISRLYRNDGGIYREVPAPMPPLSRCALAWGDYDSDGDLDLFAVGLERLDPGPGSEEFARVYHNDGGVFSEAAANFTGLYNSDAAWGDYDNDGDLDIVYQGRTLFPIVREARVYRNDGGEVFTDINAPLAGVSTGALAWSDFDNDGDLDLLVTGLDTLGLYSARVYRNHFQVANTLPLMVTATATGEITDTGALLHWSPAADGVSPALNYNLRIGTTPGGSEVMSAMANSDGRRLIAQSGTISDTLWRIGRLQPDTRYYWTVQAIDGALAGSAFAMEDSFRTLLSPFADIGAGLPPVGNGDGVWGDYDNDGDLDLALAGQRDSLSTVNPFSGIFRNDNGSFTDINAGLAQLSAGILAWGDYDNDNDLDLFLGGYPGSGSPNEAYIYRNDNGSFVDINANLTGVSNGTAEWGDFDNDGDLDLLVTGAQFVLNTPATRLYRNDDGVFDGVNTGLRDVQLGDAAWGDYDNDGDLDIALSGVSADSNGDVEIISRLYRNDGGIYSAVPAPMPPLSRCALAWGDYDSDGDLDLFAVGLERLDPGPGSEEFARVYRNDGGVFSEAAANFTGLYNSDAAWGDYDNDGDLDIVYQGRTLFPIVREARIYRNDGGEVFTDINAPLAGVSTGALAWGDVDHDDDLDLLVTGLDTLGLYSARVYRNNILTANDRPSAPGGLSAQAGISAAILRWRKSGDAQTPADGLSYSLRIGTSPGGTQTVTPMAAADGMRRIARSGAVQDTSWSINQLLPGKYYWSVQAVDGALSGSAFAPEDSFTVQSGSVILRRSNLNLPIISQISLFDTIQVRFIFPPGEGMPFEVRDVNVTIDTVLHSNVNDLVLTLIHNGVRDTLVYEVGSNGQDFLQTVLDDSAALPLSSGAPPYTGTFRPYRPLAQFQNLDPEGAWVLEVYDRGSGNSGVLDAWSLELTVGLPTAIDAPATPGLPAAFALHQNYPNPFNPGTTIRYDLPQRARVKLEVFNLLGQRVEVLVNEWQNPGYHQLQFDARRLASGVYFYRLRAGEKFVRTRKMLLIK